ncbi:MAG: hypothetical protein KKB03_04460 [Nanoarchaeota archaeon]|nr:hypothetical protein [Nanoarchaeota archaeon]MBU1135427.1 hypothetical protein [Nanoarchaeota archaeon]MBU2520466.1 hypothetical protein [Nanoarchaeota archaeon]
MGILAKILEGLCGKAHFMVLIGRKPALEITIEDKQVLIDVKNPVLALDFGMQELLKRGKVEKNVLREMKKLGYKITIKYKMFKLDI